MISLAIRNDTSVTRGYVEIYLVKLLKILVTEIFLVFNAKKNEIFALDRTQKVEVI